MHLLTLLSLLSTFFAPSISTIESAAQATEECPDGFGYINGECIKKFVPPKFQNCPRPSLKFGQYDLQIGGRVVNYWCEDGWTLVPNEFTSAVCKLGEWNKPTPQCIRAGCDELKPPDNGGMVSSHDGALVTFWCSPDLVLTPSNARVLGCDGQFWNTSVPTCDLPKASNSFKIKSLTEIIYISLLFLAAFQL